MQLKYAGSLVLLFSMLTACGGSGSGNDSDGLSLADETTDIGSTDTGIADTGITIAEPDAVTDETSTANTDPGTVDDDAGTADTGIAIADTGTVSNDSGTTNTDTGTVSNDSGTTNTDAGTASNDSGTTNTDTGTANNDSGTTNTDTGIASNDSGTTNTDTGTASSDNGTANTDTGTVSNDNSTTNTDTSTVSNDSGTTNTDTGTASSDNGTANTDTDTANNDSGTTDTDAGTTSNDTDTSSTDAGADNTTDSDVAITDDNANTDVDTINIVTDADNSDADADTSDAGADNSDAGADTSDAGADTSDAGADTSDAGADNSDAGTDNSDAGTDNSVVATDISDSDTTNTDTGTVDTDTDADTGIMSDDNVVDTSGGSNVIVCCLQEDRTPPAPGSVFISATAPVVFNRLADVSDVGPQSISLGNNSSFPGLRYGNLLMLNNAFNAGNTRWDGWSQSISLNDGAPVTADVVWDWGLESQKNQIFATTSFPELIYGTKSAAERSGTFAETGLPVEEADRPDISINYSYSRTEGVTQAPLGPNDTGAEAADSEHNVIIESFWHESCDIIRNGSPQDNVVMEMLIWYYHGERLPSGPADLFESGVLIDGQMWTVYVNSNNFNYLAYVAEDVETAERQSGTLNYSAFIEHMLANDERYGVYEVVPTDCFANISFGPEVFQGAGTFTWNDFTVTRQY